MLKLISVNTKLTYEVNMSKKPDLYTIERALIENYPPQTVTQFTLDIKKGVSPSKALNNFITSNKCTELDSSVIIDLLKQAYDGIDIRLFSWSLHDSGYPFTGSKIMNDEDFDRVVTQAYENPPQW